MDLYGKKPAKKDLEAFKEFAAMTLPSSYAFAYRVRIEKAAAVHQGQAQVAHKIRPELPDRLARSC